MGNESDAWESFCGLTEKRHAGSVCWKQQSLRPDWPGRPRPALETTGRFLRGPDLSSCGCSVDCLPALFAAAPAPDGRGLGPGHASESPGGLAARGKPVSNPEAGGRAQIPKFGPPRSPSAGNLPFPEGRTLDRSESGRPTCPLGAAGDVYGGTFRPEPAARKGLYTSTMGLLRSYAH